MMAAKTNYYGKVPPRPSPVRTTHMKLNFLFPGKTREAFLADGINSYLKRLKPMVQSDIHILKAGTAAPGGGSAAEALARSRESTIILERCGAGEYLIVLDVQGELMSSPELAAKFERLQDNGTKTVNIVVGGPWGVDENLLERANLRLSLGPMTYPHELARLIILEQVYRAYAIINKIPYHK
ncbi:23S rRNA (pseudouridine(1915)-N(3))-methyltransferase RlmH [Deltaproteobacteria bacterium Smac51]|nr:23S rRNA (pseudouridine(1915)-N(3))-methyltransferase RlmH [Deltaproteobacteria bacterium Smac51]